MNALRRRYVGRRGYDTILWKKRVTKTEGGKKRLDLHYYTMVDDRKRMSDG